MANDVNYEFWCLLKGEKSPFLINAPSTLSIYDLKGIIYQRCTPFHGMIVTDYDLTLMKVNVNLHTVRDSICAGTYQPEDTEALRAVWEQIYEVWPDKPSQGYLHIFVDFGPEVAKPCRNRGLLRLNEEIEMPLSPFSLSFPVEFTNLVGEEHCIGMNRPFERNTIPIDLLDGAFGRFKDRCRAPPSKNALTLLDHLVEAVCKWYPEETDRRTAIQDVFATGAGLEFLPQTIPGTEYETDGNLPVTIMPAAIRGCKFEIGSYMGFYGCVWDGDRIRVDALTPLFDLSIHWTDEEGREAIASSLDALMETVMDIEARYISIEAEVMAENELERPIQVDYWMQKALGFPYLKCYEDAGEEITYTYNRRLDDRNLVFTASTYTDQFIVKFTRARHYSEIAHRYLADLGLAPRLRQLVSLPGGWSAVVMDESKYEPLSGMVLSAEQQDKVRHRLSEVVNKLHEAGLIHGDIHDTDLLIDRASLTEGIDKLKIHVIGFDWAPGPVRQAK
ncbi:hypothetical protein BGW80DRAFT_1469125 [Lactifluus volemus]|nr:hypothetical protein BGW80DRAFT_1469125 [Lactifluus volemus]